MQLAACSNGVSMSSRTLFPFTKHHLFGNGKTQRWLSGGCSSFWTYLQGAWCRNRFCSMKLPQIKYCKNKIPETATTFTPCTSYFEHKQTDFDISFDDGIPPNSDLEMISKHVGCCISSDTGAHNADPWLFSLTLLSLVTLQSHK